MKGTIYLIRKICGGALILNGAAILLFGGSQRYGGPEYEGWERLWYALGSFIIGGTLLRVSWLKEKWNIFTEDDKYYVMCPQCNNALDSRTLPNNACPKCNVELEPIKGFYERHPNNK